jgi:hypothetical protein
MSKVKTSSTRDSKLYAVRDKSGRFKDVYIVRPKKAPTSVTLTEIRRAVRDTYAKHKAK